MNAARRLVCLLPPALLAGCAGSPTQNIFGSFFPSWMLCVFAGIVFSAAMRRVFAGVGIDKVIPAPFLVHLALAAAFTFALWLLWLR